MQFSNNLFKVCWNWKNTNIICYKLTSLGSLVSLWQGIIKKSEKLMKTDENSQHWQRNSSFLLNDLRNFNEIFRKDMPYDNIKSRKKPESHPLFRRYIFRKTTGWSNWPPAPPPSPAVLVLKIGVTLVILNSVRNWPFEIELLMQSIKEMHISLARSRNTLVGKKPLVDLHLFITSIYR